MKVFGLFKLYGDGDGSAVADLLSVFGTVERALVRTKEILSILNFYTERKQFSEKRHTHCLLVPVFESMTKENGYTFIGNRNQVTEEIGYGVLGGFIIEEIEVL